MNALSGRYEPPSGVVEKRAGKGLPPGFEGAFERPAVEMRAQPVFEQILKPISALVT